MLLNYTLKTISNWKTWRLAVFFVPFIVVLFWLDIFTWQIPLALLLSFLAYTFFYNKLWQLLVLAPPLIIFGTIISLQIRPGWAYEMTITEAIILMVFVVYFFERFFSLQMQKIRLDGLVFIMFFYFVWALFSYSEFGHLHNFIGQAKVLLYGLMAYFLAINLFDELYKIKAFFSSLGVLVILLSLQLFWKFYDMGFSSKFFFERSSILLPSGALALVASILAMILPLMLTMSFAEKNNYKRYFYLLATILGLMAVFMTLGKAAIGSLALGIMVIFLKFRSKRLGIALSLLSMTTLVFIFMTPYLEGFVTRLGNVTTDSNISFRIEEYVIATKILRENWLWGVGLGQEPVWYAKYYAFKYNELVNNYWLQIILDLGVIGLGLALSAFVYIMVQIKKLISISQNVKVADSWYAYGLIGCGVVVFFNGLAEVTIFALNYGILLWLLVGISKAFLNLKEQI
ncbi:MAG: O-antigen ligase family protein [bacterium]